MQVYIVDNWYVTADFVLIIEQYLVPIDKSEKWSKKLFGSVSVTISEEKSLNAEAEKYLVPHFSISEQYVLPLDKSSI